MKILELTTYSAGGCGVGGRVKQEAALLAEEHEVKIFSTDHTKGSKEKAPAEEKMGKVKIKRFPAIKLGGESFSYWNFKKEALEFKPDVIIAHAYRHTHTTSALKVGRELNVPVILVTHAPFNTGYEKRSLFSKFSVGFYDKFIGPKVLKKFAKIAIISPWEKERLTNLKVPQDKIVYIPNGIPDLFFSKPAKKEENKILYFGRISPVKDLEVLIEAFSKIKDKKVKLEIAGPAEKNYLGNLIELVKKLDLEKRVVFSEAIYDLAKKIEKIDSARIYVLPSVREGMPQTLVEAMARSKIVVASNSLGNSSLIENGKNGFLFPIGDSLALAEVLNKTLKNKQNKIQESARKSVEQFAWSKIIKKIKILLNKLTNK